jgi:hypothetical protein
VNLDIAEIESGRSHDDGGKVRWSHGICVDGDE